MTENIELLKFLGILLAVILPLYAVAYFWHRHNIRLASERWSINEINRWIDDMRKGFIPYDEHMMNDFIEMRNYKMKQNERKDQSE